MNYGLYISAAGMKAQELRQDMIANNLANTQTTGFKRDLAIVQERANAAVEDPRMRAYRISPFDQQGGGVILRGSGVDLSQGTMEETSNPTDVALQGRGFFTVGGGDAAQYGGKLLTRDGQFLLNSDGQLVTTTSGRPVLDDAGQPITLTPGLRISIDQDGTITQDGAGSVKLGIVDVSDPRKIVKLGGNVMAASDASAIGDADPTTRVLQNRIESSGVDPTVELVAMMQGQRAFDANTRMITYQDTLMSETNTIGRVA